MDIIFWQNMPSHHQAGAIRHLADHWDGKVYGVYDMDMLPGRKKQGWQCPDMGKVEMHFLNTIDAPATFVRDLVQTHAEAIHILGGFRGTQSVTLAWEQLKVKPEAKLAAIVERPHFYGWKSILQKLWYRHFFRRHGHRFKAVLAMSTLGVESFKALGCPPEILFPYLYQVDQDTSSSQAKPSEHNGPVRFVHIGLFSRRKGVDLLLDAVQKLPAGWELDFIGTGGPLESAAKALDPDSINGAIRLLGSIPSDNILARLEEYDVCIVPSRHDGWGMVTNEAITAGTGVIISDAAGSKDLIEASGAGEVIRAGCPASITHAMNHLIAHPETIGLWRQRARAYHPTISSDAVGHYLAAVLQYAFMDQAARTRSPFPPLSAQ